MDTANEIVVEKQEKVSQIQINPASVVRVPVKHANLGIRSHAMDMSTMVELTSFSTLGKIQPFLVTISTSAALVVDLHCHLTDKEVCGYLGGHWDINTHNLAITNAFPCRYAGKDKTAASAVEGEIARAMEWQRVSLVGWYHSHPRSHASPSLRDVDYQLDYQIKMKGPSDNGYLPCIGLICSPYNSDGNCYESNFNIFWSMPPPENRPHEYPRPMLLSYTILQELYLSQDSLDEVKKCIEYYKSEGGVDFNANFTSSTTYLDKLRNSIITKLPGRNRGNNVGYWDVIREMIQPGSKSDDKSLMITTSSSSDQPFMLQYPHPGMHESYSQSRKLGSTTITTSASSASTANNVFIAPTSNFKSDSNVSKSFTSQPSTSQDKKDNNSDDNIHYNNLSTLNQTMDHSDILPTFRSGELTVSVKNVKMDYEPPPPPPPIDFMKLASPLSIDALTKLRTSFPTEFPLTDLSQQMPHLPDLSKLSNFTPSDFAKLSGFSLNDLTKASSSAYARNIANLFNPFNSKNGPFNPTLDFGSSDRKSDYIHSELSKTPSFMMQDLSKFDDSIMDRKKTSDLMHELPKSNAHSHTAEELSKSSVKSTDFNPMLDMSSANGKNQQLLINAESGETLNLSKDY